jgi:hypothetical protein
MLYMVNINELSESYHNRDIVGSWKTLASIRVTVATTLLNVCLLPELLLIIGIVRMSRVQESDSSYKEMSY